MMTAIQIFESPEFGQVRTTTHNGEIAFVAKDVLERLDIDVSNVGAKIANVPDEWRGRHPIATPSGTQEMWVLTEQGLYFFLARSDKPLSPEVGGAVLVGDPHGTGEAWID
jgi:prophage antirepressor-like protein